MLSKDLIREFFANIFSPAIRRFGAGSLSLLLLAGTAFAQRITLESPNLNPGAAIPKRYTMEGKSFSPPLVWRNLPEGTRELSLLFEDLEGPRVHWLVYRIPANVSGLPEAIPRQEVLSEPAKLSGIIQGITDFKRAGPGYIGPDPSAGKEHRYRFTLYALDARMGLLPGLDKASLLLLTQGHIIGTGELVVTCGK